LLAIQWCSRQYVQSHWPEMSRDATVDLVLGCHFAGFH
jgi:hypothetical protein